MLPYYGNGTTYYNTYIYIYNLLINNYFMVKNFTRQAIKTLDVAIYWSPFSYDIIVLIFCMSIQKLGITCDYYALKHKIYRL